MTPKPVFRKDYRTRKKQSRLSFTPLPSSSPAKESYSSAIQDRLANVRYETAASKRPRRGNRGHGDKFLPTPEPSSHPDIQAMDPQSPTDLTPSTPEHRMTTDEEEEDDIVPSSKRRRTTQSEAQTLSTPVRRSTRQNHSSSVANTSPSRNDEAFSHVEIPTPSRRSSGRLSDVGSAETSDDGGDVLVSQPTRRYRNAPTNARRDTQRTAIRRAPADDWLVDDDQVDYISSEEEEAIQPRTPKRATPSRKTLRLEQQELEADLEDLRDTDQESSTRKKRTRGGPVTTERDKTKEQFELLKRRRAGEKVPRIQDSDEDEEDERGADISLIGLPAHDSDDDSVHPSVATELPVEEDDEEDDFIEDDTTGRLDRPHPDIPLKFTHWASAKPRELFPHIVEWLVKNKLAPAFSRHDDIYKLAFDRLDDQVTAQAGSRLISSAWGPEFKFTILARPQISITTLPGLDEDLIRSCDACNKINRPARYDFILEGDAYYKDSLEPVEPGDDEDESNDCDEAGHILAPQHRHFYLGSHCAANAQMGHKLSHWKFHLNEFVLGYLEEQGVLSAQAIVAREKKSKSQREREAEAIVDSMGAVGKIEELWREFQNDLDDARFGMEDYQKKGGRSQGRIGVIRSTGTDGRIREWKDRTYKESLRMESDSDGM